jgi:hypothetical protein
LLSAIKHWNEHYNHDCIPLWHKVRVCNAYNRGSLPW